MANGSSSISAIAEHSLVKAATPFIVAGICGFCAWLFTSVMSLEQQVKLLNEGTVHNLEEKVDGLSIKIWESYLDTLKGSLISIDNKVIVLLKSKLTKPKFEPYNRINLKSCELLFKYCKKLSDLTFTLIF